jgi:ParB/RepB/Spo0J family partition protein
MKRLKQFDVFALPVDQIYYDANFNCRGEFTVESVSDLAGSIREHGLQFPVVVQPVEEIVGPRPQGYKWRLLAGHRRYRAVTLFLKWPEIPATIRTGLSDHAARVLNFTENLERKDLTILEEARTLRNLFPEGVSLRQAAAELKRPTRWVHARLRLMELPEEVQAQAASGLLSAVNIEAIAQLKSPAQQIKAACEIVRLKAKGKTKFLDPRFRRRYRKRRSKAQINKMIGRLLNAGINGLAPRSLAWAAGYVPDAELIREIEQESSSREGTTFRCTEGGREN